MKMEQKFNSGKTQGLSVVLKNASLVSTQGSTKRTVLDDISLTVKPGEFLCILGTSGAGKTSLVKTLLGQSTLTSGTVSIGGVSLPDSHHALRGRIGYVQQQDINPPALPAGRAFDYAASLRLPLDMPASEKQVIVESVLSDLRIQHLRDTPIHLLSGGEAKRGSLAVEMLSKPGLLILDEATSSLDAANEARIMRTLAEQAHAGMTVVCITHHLDNVDLSDRIVILDRGSIVWDGDIDGALEHFSVSRLPDIYIKLEDDHAGFWKKRWRDIDQQKTRQQAKVVHSEESLESGQAIPWTHVVPVLFARNAEVILRDRSSILTLFLLPMLIAGMILIAFHNTNFQDKFLLTRYFDSDEKSVLADMWGEIRAAVATDDVKQLPPDVKAQIRVVLDGYPRILAHLKSDSANRIVSDALSDRIKAAPEREIIDPSGTFKLIFNTNVTVALIGFVFGIKEHVREKHIYARERMHGIPISSYVISKAALVAVVMLVQVGLLMTVLNLAFDIIHANGGSAPEMIYRRSGLSEFMFNWLLGCATACIGLVASVIVRSVEQAFLLVPILEIIQFLLGAGVVAIREGAIKIIAMLFSPVYWAFRGVRDEAQGVPFNWHSMGDYNPDPIIPFLAICGQILFCLLLMGLILKYKERESAL
jgi:ABC-type multidrug transport system ATPase subunit